MSEGRAAGHAGPFGFGAPFLLVLAGETISSLGSMLSSFAMGISVFQASGRALDFATMSAAVLLPQALLAPWAGAVADRVDRRWLICVCDALAAVCMLVLAALVWRGGWAIWQVTLLAIAGASALTFKGPASQALCADLVEPDQTVRMSGMVGLASNAVRLIAPFGAAALLDQCGLVFIVCTDLATFLVGTALVLYALREVPTRRAGGTLRSLEPWRAIAALASFFGEVAHSRAMTLLLTYSTLQSALLGAAFCLLTPLVLARHTTTDLSFAMITAAAGALAGSACLAFAGPSRSAMRAIVGCDVIASICVLAVGASESMTVVLASVFIAQACSASAAGLTHSMWIRFVPADDRGRMFAAMAMLGSLAVPLGLLASSGLLDSGFNVETGAVANSAGLGKVFVFHGAAALGMTAVFAAAIVLLRVDAPPTARRSARAWQPLWPPQ